MRCLSEEFLHIDWDEEYDLLYLEWHYYPGNDKFRDSLGLVLNLAQQKNVKFGIANVQQLMAMAPEDINWLLDNWLPELLTLSIQKIALVLPPSIFEELASAYLQKLDVSVLSFEIEFFAQVTAAYHWIKNKPLTGANLHME
ncbi:hypothetical protein [Adhaeribacter pallidiroseus]|uniref:STAS/SEC14 domain-containing protein n=1 Tax=Adhaeribacter pallidiroseus TaxID=2072847 RepID=A0A369QJQ2_9BACT|nr:hypothetical protein [Adhaeribacter pallidiroseus]RDC65141.1 hypothetical protein AHMF7616_03771 [Adhaeribacter pallidiroseus]